MRPAIGTVLERSRTRPNPSCTMAGPSSEDDLVDIPTRLGRSFRALIPVLRTVTGFRRVEDDGTAANRSESMSVRRRRKSPSHSSDTMSRCGVSSSAKDFGAPLFFRCRT